MAPFLFNTDSWIWQNPRLMFSDWMRWMVQRGGLLAKPGIKPEMDAKDVW
jgi:hypothetical protein